MGANDHRLYSCAPRERWRSQSARRLALALAFFLFSLATFGGCTTGLREWVGNGFKVGPEYCKPPAPVADDWIKVDGQDVENRHIVNWWTVFNDPQLDELVRTAYRQNRTLRAAGTRVLQARAQQAMAVGWLFPQDQQAFGQYSRINLSPNMPNNPTAASVLAPPGVPPFFFSNYSDWQTGFNMSWELDFWGRYRRSIETANAELDSTVESYDAALVTLLADVAANYTRYRSTQQRIAIARENVRIQEEVLALAEEKFRVGTTSKLDVEQAKTVLEQTRSSIPAFEIMLGQANDTLCTLLGTPPRDLAPELGGSPGTNGPPLPEMPKSVAAGLPADLMRQRPDIRSAERQIAAQSAQIGVAEADLYPSFYINGTIGYESQDLSDLLESQSFMGSIVPNFRWNILNYGRVINNVRLQQAHTLELIAEYQNTVLTAGRETQTALRGFQKSREQTIDLSRSVTAASSASQLGLEQYKAGTVDFNTVFNLESTRVQQQDQLAVAQGRIALNLIEVYRAVGGGWELRLEPEANRLPSVAVEPIILQPGEFFVEPKVERLPPPAAKATADSSDD